MRRTTSPEAKALAARLDAIIKAPNPTFMPLSEVLLILGEAGLLHARIINEFPPAPVNDVAGR